MTGGASAGPRSWQKIGDGFATMVAEARGFGGSDGIRGGAEQRIAADTRRHPLPPYGRTGCRVQQNLAVRRSTQ
jgi:hypothetical protein